MERNSHSLLSALPVWTSDTRYPESPHYSIAPFAMTFCGDDWNDNGWGPLNRAKTDLSPCFQSTVLLCLPPLYMLLLGGFYCLQVVVSPALSVASGPYLRSLVRFVCCFALTLLPIASLVASFAGASPLHPYIIIQCSLTALAWVSNLLLCSLRCCSLSLSLSLYKQIHTIGACLLFL